MSVNALERPRRLPTGPANRPLSPVQPWVTPSRPVRVVSPLRLVAPVTMPQGALTGNPDRGAVGRPAAASRLRITRRGRLVLTLVGVAFVAAAGLTAAQSPAAHPVAGRSPALVVVQPGDTLWALALRTDPRTDPRVTIERIVALNSLTGPSVQPGQRLRMPGS